MSRLLTVTKRDLSVLEALSLKVRLIGLRQIADALWGGDVANARRRMRQLQSARLLERQLVLAQPLPELLGPVCQWQPGDQEPDPGRIAFFLQSRWRYRALRPTVVYLPTRLIVDHFGGRLHRPLSAQVTHDLGVTAVWLWFLEHQPNLAALWRGENLLAVERRGESLPDAVLLGSNGEPTVLIEFGGSYDAKRIAEFHDDDVLRGLPYQIW